jgi:hypothetical protein
MISPSLHAGLDALQSLFDNYCLTSRPNYRIVAQVRGNCGKLHSTVKEWQECKACDNVTWDTLE